VIYSGVGLFVVHSRLFWFSRLTYGEWTTLINGW
jgi:hypothetical protein